MKNKLLVAGAIVMALGLGTRAQADEIVSFSLSGAGISASGSITFAPDTITGDPAGANNIIAISGLFSDSNVGISGVTITGLVPTVLDYGNSLATSLSRVPVQSNSLLPTDDDNSLTYDNLFYPGGAPDVCDDGLSGGYLDTFGMLITLGNGDEVNIWANGVLGGGAPNNSPFYGVAVADMTTIDNTPTYTAIDYQSSGLTMNAPEPGSFWLLGTGLLGTLALMRRVPGSRRPAPVPG